MKLAEELRRAVLQAAIEGKLTGGRRDGWRLVTIGDVFSLKAGKATSVASIFPEKSEQKCYPCFGGNGIRGYKSEFNEEGIHPIIGRQGALCGCLNMAEGKFYATEHAVVVTMLADTNPYFAYYALKAMNLNQYATATAQPGLSVRKILTTPFPLPPLDEQRRIVSRLDAILPLIAELEAAENELETLERKFPGDMRDALLQAAIEGRLTGSNTDNWRQVRLGDISSYGEPVTKVSAKNIPANSWLLDLEDIEKGGRILRHRTAQETKSTGDKAIFHKGDILFSKLRPYLQKVVIAPSDGYCTPELIPFHCFGEIVSQYIVYFLKAPSINYKINSESYGVKMPRVGTKTMKNLLVLLPPINEQHKIVSCLNELLPLCEALGETVYDA